MPTIQKQLNSLPRPAQTFDSKHTHYLCTQCEKGYMTPVVEEGEPDYTEHHVCLNCSFHDTIPMLLIIACQIGTSLIGVSVSIYLAFENFFALNNTNIAATGSTTATILFIAALLFTLGFLFVLYQSFKGLIKRRSYIRHQGFGI